MFYSVEIMLLVRAFLLRLCMCFTKCSLKKLLIYLTLVSTVSFLSIDMEVLNHYYLKNFLTGRHLLQDESLAKAWFMLAKEKQKILSELTPEYIKAIKEEAETKYHNRRQSIKRYCKKYSEDNWLKKTNGKTHYWNKQMWFSTQYHFAWCPVPKAASTTWTEHMSLLTGQRWMDIMEDMTRQGIPRVDHRSRFKEQVYGLPEDENLVRTANKEMFTWIFVRHPFSRLVSGYSEKLVKDWENDPNQALRETRDEILIKYRNINKDK